MNILTKHEILPGPYREFDWSATLEDPDSDIVGYGETEEEAKADLKEQLEEQGILDSLDDTERFEEREPSFSSQTGMEE